MIPPFVSRCKITMVSSVTTLLPHHLHTINSAENSTSKAMRQIRPVIIVLITGGTTPSAGAQPSESHKARRNFYGPWVPCVFERALFHSPIYTHPTSSTPCCVGSSLLACNILQTICIQLLTYIPHTLARPHAVLCVCSMNECALAQQWDGCAGCVI